MFQNRLLYHIVDTTRDITRQQYRFLLFSWQTVLLYLTYFQKIRENLKKSKYYSKWSVVQTKNAAITYGNVMQEK